MSIPLVLKVKEVIDEAPGTKSYVFHHNLHAKPGQFVMTWLPGTDEVPMSIGWQDDHSFTLTIADAGDCTHDINERIKVGDPLGIRGPYGTSFKYDEYQNIFLVGGGVGTPPMLSLAQFARKKEINVEVFLGGRTKDHLLFEKQFKELGCTVHTATDDGSKGHHGYVTDVLEMELEKRSANVDCVYTCGPEIMMVKVAQMAQDFNIKSQVSMERYMKCGFGICGQCCMDGSGIRLCKEGPVLEGERALQHEEFGKYKRDSAGVRENI